MDEVLLYWLHGEAFSVNKKPSIAGWTMESFNQPDCPSAGIIRFRLQGRSRSGILSASFRRSLVMVSLYGLRGGCKEQRYRFDSAIRASISAASRKIWCDRIRQPSLCDHDIVSMRMPILRAGM